jgi:predicted DNA binding CopG/RHH family protein
VRSLRCSARWLDFSQFKPVKFEFENKAARLIMRLPATLLAAVKTRAKARIDRANPTAARALNSILEQASLKK